MVKDAEKRFGHKISLFRIVVTLLVPSGRVGWSEPPAMLRFTRST